MPHAQSPLVSVLMPAFNAEAYIGEAIRSILHQSYTHFELIISNDGSTDATAQVIASFSDPRIIDVAHPLNMGYAENMNSLLRAAKGKYLVIQDADDFSDSNRLRLLVDFLEAHQEIDMVGSSYKKIDEFNQENNVLMPTGSDFIHNAFEMLSDPLPVLNGTVMFRRSIVEKRIFFRKLSHINRGQDDDWLFRVAEVFSIDNISEYLYTYRYQSTSMTQDLSKITYYSLSAATYVRFLKNYRLKYKVDLEEQNDVQEINSFFQRERTKLKTIEPAYLELYVAHKYLSVNKRMPALQWLMKALIKDVTNHFIWKKIIYVLLSKK